MLAASIYSPVDDAFQDPEICVGGHLEDVCRLVLRILFTPRRIDPPGAAYQIPPGMVLCEMCHPLAKYAPDCIAAALTIRDLVGAPDAGGERLLASEEVDRDVIQARSIVRTAMFEVEQYFAGEGFDAVSFARTPRSRGERRGTLEIVRLVRNELEPRYLGLYEGCLAHRRELRRRWWEPRAPK